MMTRNMNVTVHDVQSIVVETGIVWIVFVLVARYGLKGTGKDWADEGELISADCDSGIAGVTGVCVELFSRYHNNRGVARTRVSRALSTLAKAPQYHRGQYTTASSEKAALVMRMSPL